MKITINNELTKCKDLCYEESFWTGKRTITYDGISLTKVKRNFYEYGKANEVFEIKGNQLCGITINMFGNNVELARKLYWYEIVLSILVFLPCILFGAVGGALGGALGFTNLVLIRNIDKWWLKVIVSIEMALLSLLLSYLFAYLVFHTFTLFGLL